MRLYLGAWRVTLGDEEYLFEPDEMTGTECYAVEQELEGTEFVVFDDWITGIDQGRWLACQALLWFLRYKAGQPSERIDIDFPLRKLQVTRAPKDNLDIESSETDGSSPLPDSESIPDSSTNSPEPTSAD